MSQCALGGRNTGSIWGSQAKEVSGGGRRQEGGCCLSGAQAAAQAESAGILFPLRPLKPSVPRGLQEDDGGLALGPQGATLETGLSPTPCGLL